MKWIYYIPASFLIAACHQKVPDQAKRGLEKPSQIDSIAAIKKLSSSKLHLEDTITKNDTVYKIGSFLISAYKAMKFDVISKKQLLKTRISNADTLYNDRDTLILGDFEGMSNHSATGGICLGDSSGVEGVYKKYDLKFNFFMFKVDNIYKGTLSVPNYRSDPGARYYRTMIKQNGHLNTDYAKENNRVNFAGHYTIIEWGKQGETQFLAIVDRINGRVYHQFPFGVFDWYQGIKYNKDSRMLILNSNLLNIYPGYYLLRDGISNYTSFKPAVYVWTDSVFKKIE